MDIKEIQSHRLELERQIRDSIHLFESQTEMKVTGISIDRILPLGKDWQYIPCIIRTDVELPHRIEITEREKEIA